MRKNIEMELPDEQAGFRTGRGTADMLVIIQVLIEKKYMGIGGQALVIFIDYSKAFDSISHVQLFDIMLELGFPEHIGALLQSDGMGLPPKHFQLVKEYDKGASCPFTFSVCTRSLL